MEKRLGLFSDNAPFTFQSNLILEKLFNGTINFRIGGFHKGKQLLKGIEKGILKDNGTFNRKIHTTDYFQRQKITHNLFQMYEGNTVSYIIENPKNDEILYFGKNEQLKMITDPNKLVPFIPLSKDSDGGFNALFYCSNDKEGDIVIDCSYTKFFLEMDQTGTPRYLLNICSWLSAVEKHIVLKDYVNPIDYKPKFLDIKINWDDKFNGFLERKKKPVSQMKTLFVVDDSGSVFDQNVYFNKVQELFFANFDPERGDKFYIWNQKDEELNFEKIGNFLNEKDGELGTNSSLIAEIAHKEKKNNFEHLIIVTDGDVKNEEVDKSDEKVKEYDLKFSFVSTFIIKTGDEELNESVGCPYSRDCPGLTFIVDKEGNVKEQASLMDEDIEIFNNLNQINTFDDFKTKFENIKRVVRAKCLGRNANDELIKMFSEFKKNMKDINNNKEEFNKKMKEIEDMIKGGLRDFQPIAC